MGKSTISGMLERMGVPVHDSDMAARKALEPGGKGHEALLNAFPFSRHPQIYNIPAMTISRAKLGNLVFAEGAESKRKMLERIVHPLVRESQNEFIRAARRAGHKIIALDIPLLYETGAERFVDYVIVVTAPYDIQKKRVLARGMQSAEFERRRAAQMPDAEKCKRADFVVHTGLNRAHTQKQVKQILTDLSEIREEAKKEESAYDP